MARNRGHRFMTAALLCAIATLLAIGASVAHAKTWVVCPERSSQRDCEFRGNLAIQAAIDRATDGDTIRIKSGIYVPQKLQDVPFTDVILRTFLVVERKSLRLIAETGAVLDGRVGPPATAMVIKAARVEISNLTVRNFRVQEAEDDIYDGHGIFIVDSKAMLSDVTFERNQKMGLSARGASEVTATGLRMHDGHVGIWVRESAQLRVCNSVIINNDGLGAGAAANGSLRVYNTVIDRNADDGLYAKEDAVVFATNSIITRNKPFGARAEGDGQLWLRHSVLYGNDQKISSPEGKEQVRLGVGVVDTDPRLDRSGRPPGGVIEALKGDPDVHDRAGVPSRIGLQDTAC